MAKLILNHIPEEIKVVYSEDKIYPRAYYKGKEIKSYQAELSVSEKPKLIKVEYLNPE